MNGYAYDLNDFIGNCACGTCSDGKSLNISKITCASIIKIPEKVKKQII